MGALTRLKSKWKMSRHLLAEEFSGAREAAIALQSDTG